MIETAIEEHDQLPSAEELKTELSSNATNYKSRSLFRFQLLSGLLFTTTVALSTVLSVERAGRGDAANASADLGLADAPVVDCGDDDDDEQRHGGAIASADRENAVLRAVVAKGLANTASGYEFDDEGSSSSSSVRRRALDMVVKDEGELAERWVAQRYALWCLYFSTEHVQTKVTDAVFGFGTVPAWKDGWTNDGPDPCLWNGVRCDSDGLVVEIDLAQGHVTGFLPKELELLDTLKKLDLRNNPGLGDGGVPVWLKDVELLDFVDLRGCSFSGVIPSELCDSIDFLYADCSKENFSCSCCNLC